MRPGSLQRTSVQSALDDVQHPSTSYCVGLLIITKLQMLWSTLAITVQLDGFMRKIIAIKPFARRPRTDDLVAVVAHAFHTAGMKPRFLITNNGARFKVRLADSIEDLRCEHVKTAKGIWQPNARLERVNRSIKAWARRAMPVPSIADIQHRLDA